MTLPPHPGAPFPTIGGFSTDPSRDTSDPWAQTLRERMFSERVVLMCGDLDHDLASDVCLQLMALDASGDDPVQLRVDSGGGALDAAFAVIDVIDLLGVDVRATCAGRAIGPSVGVLAVAGRRLATPHSRLRLLEPLVSFAGAPDEIERCVRHRRDQLSRFCTRLASATGQPLEKIEADMRSGRYLSAEEALEYGLIDEIARPDARVLQFPRPFGFRRS